MLSRTNTSSASKPSNGNTNGCYSWEKMDPVPKHIFHFGVGWSDSRTNTHLCILQCFHLAAQPREGSGVREKDIPASQLLLHFAKCLFLALSVHTEVHSTTTVVMAATNLTACLSSIKYSHRAALNCKTGSNTAPNWSPSQLLDISYYRNQSLGTGAHSRKSCRFQFYIVINAAGEENFTTIAGADCTNADLFYPTTLQMNVPTHTIALLLVLKWFPQSLCWDGCWKGGSIFQWLH